MEKHNDLEWLMLVVANIVEKMEFGEAVHLHIPRKAGKATAIELAAMQEEARGLIKPR